MALKKRTNPSKPVIMRITATIMKELYYGYANIYSNPGGDGFTQLTVSDL